MQYRQGEQSGMFFRSDRFFCISGEWYFSTRESPQVGPFTLKSDAEAELMIYLRHTVEGGIFDRCHTLLPTQSGASHRN